jgi:hypothetical protein
LGCLSSVYVGNLQFGSAYPSRRRLTVAASPSKELFQSLWKCSFDISHELYFQEAPTCLFFLSSSKQGGHFNAATPGIKPPCQNMQCIEKGAKAWHSGADLLSFLRAVENITTTSP